MADPIKISTSKYATTGKVDIDGKIWDVKLPGAGTELRLSQAFRACKLYGSRMQVIDRKIEKYAQAQIDFDDKKITEEQFDELAPTDSDLDRYEEYTIKYEDSERLISSFFNQVFTDGTDDNTEVKKWVEETPTAVIQMAFEDITAQAKGKTNGSKESESS